MVGAGLEEGGEGEREVSAVMEFAACFEEVAVEVEEEVVWPEVVRGCPVVWVGRVGGCCFAAA